MSETPIPQPEKGKGKAQAWQQAAALFDQLATVPPEARAPVLEKTDIAPEVRAWLDKLLAAHDRDQTVMVDRQMTELVQQLMPSSAIMHDAETFYQRRFGPWQALEEIGRGGMGLVLHGQRADGQFDKQVAIKLLDPAVVGDTLERQLRHELKILASLSHPAIAQLLDGGMTEDGVPYLVMEYIDGMPINQYCHEQTLDQQQRLGLFFQVAEAVSYCHRRLVVHGDIKPDNVLVDRNGQVKLLDFGIASRLTDKSESESADNVRRWCSPAYAAPERLQGAAPAVAEDEYALAALVYELLTGARIRSAPEMTRLIAGDANADESVAQAPQVSLPGDLGAIFRRALAPDPADRYADVDALIADLQRWCKHYPVRAHAGGAGYQARKWLRRHRTLAASATLVIVALVVGLSAALWQADRAEQAAILAKQNAERASAAQVSAEQALARADQINQFLLDLFQAQIPDLPPDELPTTRQILDAGLERARDPVAGTPALRAELLISLTEILSSRLQLDETEQLLNEIEQLVNLDEQPALALRHAVVYADLARNRFNLDEAETRLQHAIDLYQEHAPDDLMRLEMQRDLARVWSRREELDRAEQALTEVMAAAEQRPDGAELALRVATDLAIVAGRDGRHELALDHFKQILDMKQSLDHAPLSIASTEVNIAMLEKMTLRYEDAVVRNQGVIDRLQPYDDVPRGIRAVAWTNLSDIARMRGQFDLAEQHIEQALAEWARVRNLDRPEDDFIFHTYRAPLLAEQGRYDEAAAQLGQAIPMMLESEEPSPRRMGLQLARQARYWCLAGEIDRAEPLLQAAGEYQHEQVLHQIELAAVSCAIERGDPDMTSDRIPEALIEQTMDQTHDASQTSRIELLRAELLLREGQPGQAVSSIENAVQRLDDAGVLTTHPLRTIADRLRLAAAAWSSESPGPDR